MDYCSGAYKRFGHITEIDLFSVIVGYSGAQRGGALGQAKIVLNDRNGERHAFSFETFFNSDEALTLGYWLQPHSTIVQIKSL